MKTYEICYEECSVSKDNNSKKTYVVFITKNNDIDTIKTFAVQQLKDIAKNRQHIEVTVTNMETKESFKLSEEIKNISKKIRGEKNVRKIRDYDICYFTSDSDAIHYIDISDDFHTDIGNIFDVFMIVSPICMEDENCILLEIREYEKPNQLQLGRHEMTNLLNIIKK